MSLCPRCGASFECAMADEPVSGHPCWCTRLPPLPLPRCSPDKADRANSRCLCPSCLRALIDAQDADRSG